MPYEITLNNISIYYNTSYSYLKNFKLYASNDGINYIEIYTNTSIPTNSGTFTATFTSPFNNNYYIYYGLVVNEITIINSYLNLSIKNLILNGSKYKINRLITDTKIDTYNALSTNGGIISGEVYIHNNLNLSRNVNIQNIVIKDSIIDFTNNGTYSSAGRINFGASGWQLASYANIYYVGNPISQLKFDLTPVNLGSGFYFVSANNGGIAGIGINTTPNLTHDIITSRGCSFNGNVVYTSDIRIKKNINDIIDDDALQKILNIQPKTYEYIDQKNKGTNIVYGFIAQQVKEVIPEAIEIGTGYMPNIYLDGTYNSNIVYLNDITNLNLNDNIKITANKQDEYYKINNINENEKYIELNKEIELNKNTNENSSNCFIYGTEVNDFHRLNKDYIFTLNVCATQELYRLIKQQKIEIEELKTEITNIKSILSRNNLS
jgi:hypothetical protein